jgi:5-methylcytosine-specific restriction endonuclease McrA
MSSGGISSGSSRVLVLNSDYSALTICSIYKAFLLVYTHKAELVSQGDHPMRSISKAYPMPSIIRLTRYISMPYRGGVILNRQNIFKRDGHSCQYCGNTRDLTLDHVHPRSRGGKTSWENLVSACKSCNNRKGDLTPEEAGMPLTQRPYKPSFVMFLRDLSGRVSEDWLTYLGQRKAS